MKKESLSTSMPKLILVVSLIVSIGALLGALGCVLTRPKIISLPKLEDISNWKTYQNKTLGYEIQYPSNWSIKENFKDNITEFISKENTVITIGFISQDILNAMGINYCGAYPNDRNRCEWIVINGKEHVIEKNPDSEGINIAMPDGGALSIGLKSTTIEMKTIFRKILSTFKFIEKDETADWKTYRNSDFNFEIKYPKEWRELSNPKIYDNNSFLILEDDTGKADINVRKFELQKGQSADDIIVDNTIYAEKPDIYDFYPPEKIGKEDFYCLSYLKGGYGRSCWIKEPVILQFELSANDIDVPFEIFDKILSTFKFIEKSETINEDYQLIFSLPFHNSDKVIKVYAKLDADSCNKEWVYCIAKGVSVDTTLKLFEYDAKNKSSVFLGNIHPVSYTGNSGGLFVPFAITKDGTKIILEAHMGDPGAGGGSVDYGYVMIPIEPAPSEDWVIEDFPSIATSPAYFYDSYGKVVYTNEGGNTPQYSKPGPSNNSLLIFRNLLTNSEQHLLEEKDTSYEIVGLDEKNKILKFKATKYTFPENCPKEEDSLSSDCVRRSTTERTIVLP